MKEVQPVRPATRPLRTLELFAGVGGFRLGLNAARGPGFEVVWANQWEPGVGKQWAAEVYRARWGNRDLVNADIRTVLASDEEMARIDVLDPEVLVGGFPCQDYSVARPRSHAQGLEGEKGQLWWSIHRLLEARLGAQRPVRYLMLENVDRLLSSPSACRGHDFAVMLASLQQLGYAVEWRVVNAADYGFAQRRRRVFILGYHPDTADYVRLLAAAQSDADQWLTVTGTMARAFPARFKAGAALHDFALPDGLRTPAGRLSGRFAAGGVCVAGRVWTAALEAPVLEDFSRFTGQRHPMTLGAVVAATDAVPQSFYLDDTQLPRWRALKGAKAIGRVSADGRSYVYSEGGVQFPDALDRPSRTLVTGEGGCGPSRTTHGVAATDGRLRRLTPEELEALNGFPRGFTAVPGITPGRRGFLMGNALVTGLVARLGQALCDARAPACGIPDETTSEKYKTVLYVHERVARSHPDFYQPGLSTRWSLSCLI